jgi:S-adenosylmethionine/arginine decarboxylase-like enzyme
MVIGSNKIDFFNHTLKDHGVELLVLESQDEINEKFNEFYRFTEYRKNDARKQGQCRNQDSGTENMQNAGILMVVEAEKVTHDLTSTDTVEKTLTAALTNAGFSVVSAVKHGSSSVVIVTKEGYVSARLFPEHNYVGLDIQNWANFDLMEKARDALVQSLGGTEEGTSSFRIVTGGMNGSPFEDSDRSKVGPRMVNSRDCGNKSSPAASASVDPIESGLNGSLELVEDGIIAAVLCGSKDAPCKSVDILKNDSGNKIKTVVPVHTCRGLLSDNAEFSSDIAKRMSTCEFELATALATAGGDEKISLLVVDESAKQIMGKVLLGIFTSVWNRKRLFAQHRFVALVDGTFDAWRRNLLLLIREVAFWSPLSLVDVKVENSDKKSKLSILSLHDPELFLHLSQMVEKFDQVHGGVTTMEVENVFDGMVPPQIGHFKPKIFKPDDYDQKPAREQLAGQKSLGRQSIIQFEIKPRPDIPNDKASAIKSALSVSVPSKEELKYSTFDGNVGEDAGIGDGQIVVGISSEVFVIVVWDGNTHIDVNLYLSDEDLYLHRLFISTFVLNLGKTIPIQKTLSDTHPRGIGRVVSFPGHLN